MAVVYRQQLDQCIINLMTIINNKQNQIDQLSKKLDELEKKFDNHTHSTKMVLDFEDRRNPGFSYIECTKPKINDQ